MLTVFLYVHTLFPGPSRCKSVKKKKERNGTNEHTCIYKITCIFGVDPSLGNWYVNIFRIPRSCSWMLSLFLSSIVVWCLWFSCDFLFCLAWTTISSSNQHTVYSHQQDAQLCQRPNNQMATGCCCVSMAFPQCFCDANSDSKILGSFGS